MKLALALLPAIAMAHGVSVARNADTALATTTDAVDHGRNLVFSADGLPPGVSIDPQTGHISGSISRAARWGQDDVFRVRVSFYNNDGGSGRTTVDIRPVNHKPLAVGDKLAISRHARGSVQFRPLDNDFDEDGDTLDFVSARAKHGTVVTSAGGTMVYLPGVDVKDDVIEYSVGDGHGGVGSGKVYVSVAK